MILVKGRLDVAAGQTYSIFYDSQSLFFRVGNNSAFDGVSSNAIPLNTYTHFAATYDGATITLYVNGVLVASKTTTIGTLHNDDLGLGIGGGGGLDFFTGAIDEISLYNRPLSASEITAIFGSTGATPPGTNVNVQANGVSVTFAHVTSGGTTTVAPINPNSAGTVPSGYAISGSSVAFEVTTTAAITPPIDLCFQVPAVNDPAVFANLRVLHSENSVLVDRTLSHDFPARTVCARTTTLSPFLIATATQNPIDGADLFVLQHYRDFLNREPDAEGLQFWSDGIEVCGSDAQCQEVKRINTSAAFFLSIEFQETGYLLERVYKSSYGDATGTSTLGGTHQLPVPIVRFDEFLLDTQQIGTGVVVLQPGWEAVFENNKQAFIAEFVQRTRFMTAFPSTMTPAQFVDALFANAGVTPSASDRQAAVDEFGGAGTSANLSARGRALRRVAENGTLAQQEFNRAFVLMQYFGYLRRNPNDHQDTDYTGYDFWLTKLNQFNGNYIHAEMVRAFIASIEYRGRFGP